MGAGNQGVGDREVDLIGITDTVDCIVRGKYGLAQTDSAIGAAIGFQCRQAERDTVDNIAGGVDVNRVEGIVIDIGDGNIGSI